MDIDGHSSIFELPQGVHRSICNDNQKTTGETHKLLTYILIQKTLVDKNVHFPKNKNAAVSMIVRASENVNDLLNPLFVNLDTNLFKLN